MTVGYSLCCTLPPSSSLSPPSPAPTFLSSSLVRAALLSVPLSPSISGKRRREKGRENTTVERFVSRTDLSRCRVEPHYRLPVNSNRVIEEANFSWTGSVFLEIGRGLVNLGPCPPPFSPIGFIVFAIARVVSSIPGQVRFCFVFDSRGKQARL